MNTPNAMLSRRRGRTRVLLAVLAVTMALATGAADAQRKKRKKEKPAPKPPAVSIRVILPQALDASGVLAAQVEDFVRRNRIGVKFVPASLTVALKLANQGDADAVIFDHHPTAKKFVAEKKGIGIADVMYTDLMIVGPASDPAGIAGMVSVVTALRRIARSESPFISRGDGSTTVRVERQIWAEISRSPKSSEDTWYTQTGADMRTTLGLAAAKNAYTITDRATWLRFRTRKQLVVMVDHDPRLMLRYSIVRLNPATFSGVNEKAAVRFVAWLTSKAVQTRIGRYAITKKAPFSPHYGLNR